MTSISPTLYDLKPGAAGVVCACAAPMKASGLSSPNAAEAPAAPMIRSRRETSNIDFLPAIGTLLMMRVPSEAAGDYVRARLSHNAAACHFSVGKHVCWWTIRNNSQLDLLRPRLF